MIFVLVLSFYIAAAFPTLEDCKKYKDLMIDNTYAQCKPVPFIIKQQDSR